MSEALKCDGCDTYFQPMQQHFKLENDGMTPIRFDRYAGPWHFHNEACLATWAKKALAEMEQG